ncbi:MAG: type II toxin-antitoxin system VapC family toxin [Candidatus Aquilonibacter sp.]
MRILIDSHILMWVQLEPEKLPKEAREILNTGGHDFFFSAASIWEIAIKAQLGRTNFRANAAELAAGARNSGFVELPITSAVAASVADLPMHHADPFDRLLIAQAMYLPARLLTVDKQLVPYSELVMLL